MKKVLTLLLLPFTILAIETGGFLEVGKTAFTGLENSPYFPIYNLLRIENRIPGENLRGMVSFDIRYYDYTDAQDYQDLANLYSLYPLSVSIYEAYFEITGFLLENLDLKVGKQRIAWGTADKFNPTDNLNPIDLSNPFNFGEKIPTLAIQGNYYIGDWTLTGVILPVFKPALLPSGGLIFPSGDSGTLNLPEYTPENLSYAVKIAGNLMNFDVSLSYFYGFDGFPIPDSAGTITRTTYGFDREQVIGFDFSGEVASVGVWGEIGYVLPEEYRFRINTINYDSLGVPHIIPVDTVFLKDPYYRLTVGFDYTLPWEIYINTQYIHGMPFERKEMVSFPGMVSGLGDYLFGRVERRFSDGNLKLSLGFAGEMREDSLAYGIIPGIEYHPVDNAKVTLGYLQTWGSKTTFFGNMKDLKMAFIQFRFDF